MKRFLCGLGVFSLLGLIGAGCVAGEPDESEEAAGVNESPVLGDVKPTGKGMGIVNAEAGSGNGLGKPVGGGGAGNGISYHGGPVMTGTVKLYYIWYGDWANNTGTSILTDFANNLGGSPYWNINSTYTDAAGTHLSNAVTFGGSTTDAYSKGTALADADIQTIVSSAISANKLPKDTNGIYFVLTSADVNATSGFCSKYCGWHTHATIAGSDIKYSFVGNPDRCPASCAAQTTSPNGNAGADGMASILAHEAEEAATDPDLNAWYDNRGYENADKCAWTFGSTYTVANGSKANVHLGARDYYIQQNWVNANGGLCAMSY